MGYDVEKPIYVWPVDMKGPAGNGFAMVGHGIAQLKKFGADKKFIDLFVDEAMSGDYDHLKKTIRTFFNVMVPETTYTMLKMDDEEDED